MNLIREALAAENELDVSVESVEDVIALTLAVEEYDHTLSQLYVSEEGLKEFLKRAKDSMGTSFKAAFGLLTSQLKRAKKLERSVGRMRDGEGQIQVKSEMAFLLPEDATDPMAQFAYNTQIMQACIAHSEAYLEAGKFINSKVKISEMFAVLGRYAGVALSVAAMIKIDELKPYLDMFEESAKKLSDSPLQKLLTTTQDITIEGVEDTTEMLSKDRVIYRHVRYDVLGVDVDSFKLGVANNRRPSDITAIPALTKKQCQEILDTVGDVQGLLKSIEKIINAVNKYLTPTAVAFSNNAATEAMLGSIITAVEEKGKVGNYMTLLLQGSQQPLFKAMNHYNRVCGVMLNLVEKSIKAGEA